MIKSKLFGHKDTKLINIIIKKSPIFTDRRFHTLLLHITLLHIYFIIMR